MQFVAARHGDDDAASETFDLTESLDPHALLLEWVDEFGEFLDPKAPLDDERWEVLLSHAGSEASKKDAPFGGELETGQVLFAGPNLVLVRIDDRNVNVRVRADVVKGETVRVGLSLDGQPRVLEVRGTRIDVP